MSDALGDGLCVAGNTILRRGSCPVKKSSVRKLTCGLCPPATRDAKVIETFARKETVRPE